RLQDVEAVAASLVMAREDGSGQKQLVAYVVPAVAEGDGSALGVEALDVEAIRTQLQAQLPEYMVPSAYVVLETLPLTPNGKVDRKALPAPDSSAYAQGAYVGPQTELEKQLVQLWAELLSFPAEEISTRANFFALGGHSLLVVKMIARLQQQ